METIRSPVQRRRFDAEKKLAILQEKKIDELERALGRSSKENTGLPLPQRTSRAGGRWQRVCQFVIPLMASTFLLLDASSARAARVAVLYFENTIPPDRITSFELGLYAVDPQYDYLERALTDMLITDLAQVPGVEMVERTRVEKFLQEIRLGESGGIDPATAQKAGRALQADFFVYGIIDRRYGRLRISARLQAVANPRIELIGDVEAKGGDLFELEKRLAEMYRKRLENSTASQTKPIMPAGATLAILPFNNNSKGGMQGYLRKTVADLVTADLAARARFRLVERDRLEEVLKELAFQKSEVVDERTALQIGKLLGAQYILFGSYIVNQQNIRLDVRIAEVESSRTFFFASSEGPTDKVAGLTMELMTRIRETTQ